MARSTDHTKPLPASVFHILLALGGEEQHGYAIMGRVEEITDGSVSMGPGTLYGSIKRMLADGLIEETEARPDPELDDERRRYYRVTADGARARAVETARMETLLQHARVALASARKRLMSERMYRAVTYLYPPRFRREYGDPMVQMFADRVRRDGARRAWWRSTRDVAISAPYEYWETVMNGSPQTKLIAAAVITGTAAIAFILVGGALVGLVLLIALAWQLYSIQRMRGHEQSSSQRWWKLAAGGAGLFAVLFVIFAMPWPEDWRSSVDGEVAWTIGMVGFTTSFVLVLLGLFMGFAQWVARRSGSPA